MESYKSINSEKLECVGKNNQKPFLMNPVALQSGYFMCFGCGQNYKSQEEAKCCNISQEERKINFETKQIKACLDQLFQVVHEACNSSVKKLKDSLRDKNEPIELDLDLEYLKQEIDTRMESIKIDLNEQFQEIHKDLKKFDVLCNNKNIKFTNKKSSIEDLIIPLSFKRSICVDVEAYDFCVLSDNRLLASNYLKNCLCLYDRNMQLMETVKQINSNEFKPFAIATNGVDRIYISDRQSNKIIMTDLDFNLSSTFESNQLQQPVGLCYSNNLIYVADTTSKSVHVLNSDLTFKASYQLYFAPWHIQVIDDMACIRHCSERSIGFYKLPEFSLKYKYDGHNGFICIANSKFYEFYQPTKTFYCYNSDGTILLTRNIFKSSKLRNLNVFDALVYFGGKFVLSSTKYGHLIMP